jgi:hypothetical protein
MKFGGKPTKTSSDSKRHFTVVMGGKEHGLYVSSTPSSAARKAVTKLCTANKSKKVEFNIREITQGSKKKTYGPYEGYIEKLKEPIELKGRVIRYKPVAKLGAKKSVQKGGMEQYKYNGSNEFKDSEYRAIRVFLEHDSLTKDEQKQLGIQKRTAYDWIDPGTTFFKYAKTYLWRLIPDDFNKFDYTKKRFNSIRYYYFILKIKPTLRRQSIYIASKLHRTTSFPKFILIARGVGKEEFIQNLFRVSSYVPDTSGSSNRHTNYPNYEENEEYEEWKQFRGQTEAEAAKKHANIQELTSLIEKRMAEDEFSDLKKKFDEVKNSRELREKPMIFNGNTKWMNLVSAPLLNNRPQIESGVSAPPLNLNNFTSAPYFNNRPQIESGASAPT